MLWLLLGFQNKPLNALTGGETDAFKFSSIPMTLNPHIKKLFVRNTSLERLDATLQFYPNLEELDLSENKIQVSHLATKQMISGLFMFLFIFIYLFV